MRKTRVSPRGSFAPLAAGVGMVALAAMWAPPLAGFVPEAFVRHMLVDVATTAAAAPLAAGLAGMLRRPVPLPPPLPASAAAFAMLWLWHMPLLHGLAALSPLVRGIEGLCLLGAGLVLWASALRAAASGKRAAGILALLLTATQIFVLGTLLTLAWRPLYTADIRTLGDVYAHLAAQRAGGLVLLAGGGIHLAGALWLVRRLLRPSRDPTARRLARGGAGPACASTDVAGPALPQGGDLP